jgi:hypothetical protein
VRSNRPFKGIAIVLLIAAVLAIAGFVVMSLWNWLIPSLFAGPVLSFWQAIGLLVLTRLLFGRIGGGRRHGHWGWRGRMRQDWQRMTPEEREKLRENFNARCGSRRAESEPKSEPTGTHWSP